MFLLSFFLLFARAEVQTVPSVNFEKYLGTWNELASIPASFQKKCYKNTSAKYSVDAKGLIRVINSCEKIDGKIKSSEGRARINPDLNEDGKLEVTFVKLFNWIWSFAGDYWIIDLDANYKYVIVGHPKRQYAWILSRSQTQSVAFYKRAQKVLEKQGYDTCKILLSRTRQQDFKDRPRLCDI